MGNRLTAFLRRPEPALAFALAVLLAGFAATAFATIPPAGNDWGFDLRALDAYHHCALRDTPYEATAAQCREPGGRALIYPPLLYWSFAWMRAFSFPVARALWTAVTALALLWLPSVWSRGATPARWWMLWGFGALLAVQFPALFALERGNSDIVVVASWTLATGLFMQGSALAAGAVLGALVPFKVYPAIGCVVVAAGLVGTIVRGERADRLAALRLGGGIAAGSVALGLLLFKQNRYYVTEVLPRFVQHLPAMSLHSHSVPATFREPPFAATLVTCALIGVWAASAFFRFRSAPREHLAGALAISTYAAATSFDYDLITVYPLLFVVFRRCLEREGRPAWWAWGALVAGVVVMVAPWAYVPGTELVRVVLQLAWLASTPLLFARFPSGERRMAAGVSALR